MVEGLIRCIASLRKENSSSDRRLESGGGLNHCFFSWFATKWENKKTASGLLGNGMGVMGGGELVYLERNTLFL